MYHNCRNCFKGPGEAPWLTAVKQEIKVGQKLVLELLLKQKSAKYFTNLTRKNSSNKTLPMLSSENVTNTFMSCYQGADVVKKNLFDDNMEQHQPELVNSTIGLTPEESDSVYSLGSSDIPSSLSTDRPPSTICSWSSSDSIFLELDNELPHPDKVNSDSLTKFQIRKMENCRLV